MVQVKVTEGILEGEVVQNEYGGSYCSFKGVPYAAPPVGDLRFKAPRPPKTWSGVRSAKEFGPQCFQFDIMMKTGVMGSEDCLYLNVYTPDIKPDKPLPVMFFIHGGAFLCGSGNDDVYSPEFLVSKEVVLVTINYRLEVLGFLCLDTEDVPGNAGMKDQVAALRWVNKNISSFGGDPNNVTIFGESAGGASVSYHLVSPMSKGLFRRAIAQSGVLTCPWTQVYKPRERAFMLGRTLGLDTEDAKELHIFLKKQPLESLIKAQVPILLSEKAIGELNIYFAIVSEKEFPGEERFLCGDIYNVLSNGIHEGVDVIAGYTTDEGLININSPEDLEKKLHMAKNYEEHFVPKTMALSLPIDKQLEVGQLLKQFHCKNGVNWETLANFYSYGAFVFWVIQFVKFCASKKRNNIYLYKFSCKSDRNIFAHLIGFGSVIGTKPVTSHADDLLYLFNAKFMKKVDMKSETFKLIDRVTKIWTNFAKFGNPTPDNSLGVKWTPYTLDKQTYMDIGNELVLGSTPDQQEIQFWEDLFRKYAPRDVYK